LSCRYNAQDHPIPYHKPEAGKAKAKKLAPQGDAPDLEEAFVRPSFSLSEPPLPSPPPSHFPLSSPRLAFALLPFLLHIRTPMLTRPRRILALVRPQLEDDLAEGDDDADAGDSDSSDISKDKLVKAKKPKAVKKAPAKAKVPVKGKK